MSILTTLLLSFLCINTVVASHLPAHERLSCYSWFKWDLSEKDCVARGCVYAPSLLTTVWCYYPQPRSSITHVHVVQGCHLDIGFVRPAVDIVNLWFHHHLPLATRIGELLAAESSTDVGTPQLRFTAQSYIVSLFFNCREGGVWQQAGVVCPNSTTVEVVKRGLAKGYITYHAFPFNGEAEAGDRSLFDFGLQMTQELSRRLNVTSPRTMSQRDVPGLTRSIIPLLNARGVRALSIGANDGSAPVNVPKSFIWRDPVSNQSTYGLYVQGGYGGADLGPLGETFTAVPGSTHVLSFAWRGDNQGPPPTTADVQRTWRERAKQFPRAQIISSTFDRFVDAVVQQTDDADWPVIDTEFGDTWIYGVASDPVKLQQMRAVARARTRCEQQQQQQQQHDGGGGGGGCQLTDPAYYEFSRLFLKSIEHTWGVDNKKALPHVISSNWTNADLAQIVETAGGQLLSSSWVNQRKLAIDTPIARLPQSHPLRTLLEEELTPLVPELPPLAGFHVTNARSFPSVWFDETSGAINGEFWLQYQTYDAADYKEFLSHYNYGYPLSLVNKYDFDKVGIKNVAKKRILNATLDELYVNEGNTTFLLHMSLPEEAVQLAGAPADIWVNFTTPGSVSVQIFNKSATRLPEAMFARYVPSAACDSFVLTKLGQRVAPSKDWTIGGSPHLHAVDTTTPVTCSSSASASSFLSKDAPLLCIGMPTAFPTPITAAPDSSLGLSAVLWDNLWNTNYIMWFPYNNETRNVKWRFEVSLQ